MAKAKVFTDFSVEMAKAREKNPAKIGFSFFFLEKLEESVWNMGQIHKNVA